MKNYGMLFLGVVGLLGMAPATAYADDAPAPSWALTGAIDGQSDYRFRGISQTNGHLVPQGTFNLSAPDGFYVGTWISKIDWTLNGTSGNPNIEWDIYGGKHFDLGGTDLNVEAYEYAYPDAQIIPGTPAASYFEGIFTLTHAFGPITLDAVYAISPEFSLGSGTGNYVEGQMVMTLTDWLTASANIGHQWVQLAPSDYTHADVGVTATWKMLSLDLRYSGTDLSRVNCGFYMPTARNACRSGFVGTLSWNFSLLP